MTTCGACASSQYYPYGEEITSTNNDTYKFAQTYRDSDSGLDYAQARYYASDIGRFLTVDPKHKSAKPKAPQTWNRYSYALGDPVGLVDPTGTVPNIPGLPGDPGPTNVNDCVWTGGINCAGAYLGGPLVDLENQMENDVFNLINASALAAQANVAATEHDADNALNNNNCPNLFNLTNGDLPNGQTPAEMLAGLIQTASYQDIPADSTGFMQAGTNPNNNNLIINTAPGSSFLGQNPGNNAVTLIHELVHAAVNLWGPGILGSALANFSVSPRITLNWIQNDGNSSSASTNNQSMVAAACGFQ
jgi:RHS repeat-associated protein